MNMMSDRHSTQTSRIPARQRRWADVRWGGGSERSFDHDAELEARRLRYFRDLLAHGYQCAVAAGDPFETLRSERLALHIDRPELDVVGIWSRRNAHDAITIPFVDFILRQIQGRVAAICLHDHRLWARAFIPWCRLMRILDVEAVDTAPCGVRPELTDRCLPTGLVERLAEVGGIVDELVTACAPDPPARGRAPRTSPAGGRIRSSL